MKKYKSKERLEFPAGDVLALITTPEYIEEEAVVIGAVRASAKEVSRDNKNVVIEVAREDPTREPGAKPGQTENNSVTIKWDLGAMKDTWTVKVRGKEKLVSISGATWIEADGDGCIIKEEGGVDIKVPIVGNMIAKGIADDLSKNIGKKAKLIRQKLS